MTDHLAPSQTGSISPLLHASEETVSTPSCTSHHNSDSESSSDVHKSKSKSRFFTSPKLTFSVFSSKSKDSPAKSSELSNADTKIAESGCASNRLFPEWSSRPSVVTWNSLNDSKKANQRFVDRNIDYHKQDSGAARISVQYSSIKSPSSPNADIPQFSSPTELLHSHQQELSSSSRASESQDSDTKDQTLGTTDASASKTDFSKPAQQKTSLFSTMMKKISSVVRLSKKDPVETLKLQAVEAFEALELARLHLHEAERRAADTESRHSAELVQTVEALAKAEASAKKWSWMSFGSSSKTGNHDVGSLRAQVVEAKRILEELRAAAAADLEVLRRRVADAQEHYRKFAEDPRLTGLLPAEPQALPEAVALAIPDVDLASESGESRQSTKRFKYLPSPKITLSFFGGKKDKGAEPAGEEAPARDVFGSLPSVVTWNTHNAGCGVRRVLDFPEGETLSLLAKGGALQATAVASTRSQSRLTFNFPSLAIGGRFPSISTSSSKDKSAKRSNTPPPPTSPSPPSASAPEFRSLPSVVTWYTLPLTNRAATAPLLPLLTQPPIASSKSSSWLLKSSRPADESRGSGAVVGAGAVQGKSSSFFSFSPKLPFSFFSAPKADSVPKPAPTAAGTQPTQPSVAFGFRQLPSVVTWYSPPPPPLPPVSLAILTREYVTTNIEPDRLFPGEVSGNIAVNQQALTAWRARPSVVTWYQPATSCGPTQGAEQNPPATPRTPARLGTTEAGAGQGVVSSSGGGGSGGGFFNGLLSRLSAQSPSRRAPSKLAVLEEVATPLAQPTPLADTVESTDAANGSNLSWVVTLVPPTSGRCSPISLDVANEAQTADRSRKGPAPPVAVVLSDCGFRSEDGVAAKLQESRHRKQHSLSEARRNRLRQGNYSYSDTWNFRQLPLEAFVEDFVALYPTSGQTAPLPLWEGLEEAGGVTEGEADGAPEVNKQFMRDAPCMVKINGHAPQGDTPERQALEAYRAILGLCRRFWCGGADGGPPPRDSVSGRFALVDGLARFPPVPLAHRCCSAGGGPAAAPEDRAREVMLLANQNMGILLYEEAWGKEEGVKKLMGPGARRRSTPLQCRLAWKRLAEPWRTAVARVTLAHPDYIVLQTGRHGVDVVLKELDRTVECRAVFELFHDPEASGARAAAAAPEFDRKFVSARAVVDLRARNVFISQSQPYDDSVVRAGINRQSTASPLLAAAAPPSPPLPAAAATTAPAAAAGGGGEVDPGDPPPPPDSSRRAHHRRAPPAGGE